MSATADAIEIECRTCGAALRLAPELRSTVCPYCASPTVVERPALPGRPRPSFVIGFVVPHDAAVARVRAWARRAGPFRRSDLHLGHVEDLRGIYVPVFLYGATARSRYRATIGERYRETQTYTVTVNGRTQTRTRTVTKTEWRPLTGEHATYVADVLVTASRGLANDDLSALEPFDLRALHRYTPAILSGFLAEEPSLAPDTVWNLARAEAREATGRAIARFMPGDTHRDLAYETQLDAETLELVLVPVWVLALRYAADAPPLRLLVNGQTGEVVGRAPLAIPRIVAFVLLIAALVVAAALALGATR